MTAWIGPVSCLLYEPQITRTSAPTALGIEMHQHTGLVEWTKAHQLRELVDNPARRVTIGGQSGVLEVVWFDDDLLGPLTGWALLQSFQLGQADQSHSLEGTSGLVPYTLSMAVLGPHRQVVLARSARDKGNDYGLTPVGLVANPFWDEVAAGGPFVTDPGAARLTREYDASFPHSTPALTPDTEADRNVSYYLAPIVGGTDPLSPVLLPRVPEPATVGSPPGWVTDRGGDARAYNRREMREVYGPHHHLEATTDLMLVNGLCRFWVGNKGLRPFLHCEAFASGAWHEVGTVQFGSDSDILLAARLVRITGEEVTAALTVANRGEVFVTLRRAERLLRIVQPAGMPLPTWSGLPPTSRLNSARVTPAHYGSGLVAGSDAEDTSWAAPFATWVGDSDHDWDGSPYLPDLRLRWPADVSPQNWQRAYRYKPLLALASLGTVGLLSIYDSNGVAQVELYIDGADSKAKARVADTVVLQSSVLTFAANDDVIVGLGYDGTTLTLSWRNNAGTIMTTSAAVSIAASAFYDEAFFVNFSRFGDGSFGDGDFGGTTHFPGGVIDNDMVLERALTAAEFATLCAGATPLAGLPTENGAEGTLRRYVSFDPQPIVTLPAPSGGCSVDSVTDSSGFTKAVAAVKADLTDVAVFLVRSGDSATAQHAQAAAQNQQQVRVR